MDRLRGRSDFRELSDGSRSMDNFNTPPQPSFDSEEMRGSMQAILAQNIGEYVVIEFLIGTEQMIRKQGMLDFCGPQLCHPVRRGCEQLYRVRHLLGEVCLLLHARRPAAVQLQPAAACQRGARHGDAPEVRAAFPPWHTRKKGRPKTGAALLHRKRALFLTVPAARERRPSSSRSPARDSSMVAPFPER